jgi:predicted dehydrogenase
MMRGMTTSRRTFLRGSVAGAGALVAPVRLPQEPVPTAPARLRLLVIGVAGRGADNLHAVAGEDVRVLCDVDRRHLEAAGKTFPGARLVDDYRPILRDPDVARELDAVVVSTPDHTHYLPTLLALQRGLHVYCEKPLTQTVAQARRLLQAAAAKGCVTQMGTQIHANANYRRVVEAVRAGAVGAVREVVVFVNGTDWSASALPPEQPVPAHVAWDLWLGPAAVRPFSDGYHPAAWRRYWAFGGGTTADMGCHFVDLAFWALDLDAPTSLQADGPEPDAECAPVGLRCRYEFPARGARPPVVLRWHGGKDRPEQELAARGLQEWRNGVLFVGDRGWLIANYDRHVVGPTEREPVWQAPSPSLPDSPGHHAEWLAACRSGGSPSCSFAYAVPLTETVLLANVAFRAARGKLLRWDAAAMRTDSPAADALLDAAARDGFSA